ncbi:hypothetical protein SNK03_005978 [Fusarium graminearum]
MAVTGKHLQPEVISGSSKTCNFEFTMSQFLHFHHNQTDANPKGYLRDMTVVMWLDPQLAAACDMALIGIVQWAAQVSQGNADLSLLTMAVERDNDTTVSMYEIG